MELKRTQLSRLISGEGGGGGGGSRPTYTPDDLKSQDWFEALLCVGQGPIKGLKQGVYSMAENFFVGDTRLSSPGTGETNFTDFSMVLATGRETDPPTKFFTGGAANNIVVNVNLSQGVPVVRSTNPMYRGAIDRLEVRILFQQLVVTNDKGTWRGTAEFSLEYKPSASNVWQKYEGKDVVKISGKTSAGAVKDFIIDVPRLANDDWDVRVVKISPDNNGANGLTANLSWESLQLVEAGTKKYDQLATVHVFAKATNIFSSVPTFSGIYDGLIVSVPTNFDAETRTYDERTPWDGTFRKEFTNDPAWLMHEIATNPEWGIAAYFPHISADRYSFYEASKWFSELVTLQDGTKQHRFSSNMLITEGQQGMELLRYIAGSVSSVVYDRGDGVLTIKTDKPTIPRHIIGPESVTPDGFSYQDTDIANRHNDITATFINPDLDWNEDRRKPTIDNTRAIELNGRISYDWVAVGCTNGPECERRANYYYLSCNTEVLTVAFAINRKGMLFDLLDNIYIADPNAGWSKSGRVKDIDLTDSSNPVVTLRDPIRSENPANVTFSIETTEGIYTATTSLQAGLNYVLGLRATTPFPTNGQIPDRAQFSLSGGEFGIAKPFRVVALEFSDVSTEILQVSAVEVNLDKYEDGDRGVQSDPIDYAYRRPDEAVLPDEWVIESGNAHVQVTGDGSLIHRIWVNWKKPFNANTAYYEIDFKEQGTDTWTTVRAYDDEAYLAPVKDGSFYSIRLYAVAPVTNRRSPKYLERIDFLVQGKSGGLQNVTGVDYVKNASGYRFTWNEPTDFPDLLGTEIRLGDENAVWHTAQLVAKNVAGFAYQHPWLPAGVTRFLFKYKDTSTNYSDNAAAQQISVDPPKAPEVSSYIRGQVLTMKWDDCETDQPISNYLLRWGGADSTPENGSVFVSQTSALTMSVTIQDPTIRKAFLRAVDAGGNVSPWTEFPADMEDTKDPTPPPTPINAEIKAGLNTVLISHDFPEYRVGHGHKSTRIYGTQVTEENPNPVFSPDLFIQESVGAAHSLPADLGTSWRFWITWVTNDGFESLMPAGPLDATTGKVGDKEMADDLNLADKLADGSISGTKIAEGALDSTKFAQGIEPVTIIEDNKPLPTTKSTTNISWQGSMYTWNSETGKYEKVQAEIQDGSLGAEKFEPGIEPVTIIPDSEELPTTKKTTNISWKGALYTWNAADGKYEKVQADIPDGSLGADKFQPGIEPVTIIPDDNPLPTTKTTSSISWKGNLYTWNASENKYERVQAEIQDGTLGPEKFQPGIEPVTIVPAGQPLPTTKSTTNISWNGTLYSWNNDTGKYEEIKAGLSGEIGGNNLCRDSSFEISATGITALWGNYNNGGNNTSTFRYDAGRQVGKSRVTVAGSTPGTTLGSRFFPAEATFLGSYKEGVTYTISFYAKKKNGAGMTTAGLVFNVPRPPIVDVARPALSTGWQRYVFTVTFPESKVGELYITANGTFAAGDEIWIDDVQIEEGTLVTAYAPHPSELLPGSVSGVFIADDAITAPKIAAEAIVAGKLSADAVVARNISANAVTSDKITANAIIASKIAAGAVVAEHIQAGAVTASKLVIADFTNLITNSQLSDGDAWGFDAGVERVDSTATADNAPGLIHIGPDLPANRYARFKRVPVIAGTSYLLSAYYKVTGNSPRVFTPRMGITWYDKAGVQLSSQSIINPPVMNSTAPVYAEGVVTAPATAAFAQCIFGRVSGAGEAGPGYIMAPEFRPRTGGSLIVDGAITTDKVSASAITADKVAANAITAAKIAAGSIGADHIQANSITASKLVITDTSNLVPDPSFEDPDAWTGHDGFYTFRAPTGTLETTDRLATWAGGTLTGGTVGGYVTSLASSYVKVEPSSSYFVSGSMRSFISGTEGQMRVYAQILKSDGTVTTSGGWLYNLGTNTAEQTLSGLFETPADAIKIRLLFRLGYSANGKVSGNFFVYNPIIRKATSSVLLADGAVTADKVAANAITAAKIAAGSIGADHISANSITADKLLVSSSVNLLPDTQDWAATGAASAWIAAGFTRNVAGSYVYLQHKTIATVEPSFDILAGTEYLFAMDYRGDTGNARQYVELVRATDNSSFSPRLFIANFASAASSTFTSFSNKVVAPETARVKIKFFANDNQSSSTGGYFRVRSPSLRAMTPEVLIADGAVTADKVAANAITADKITAGSVTAAKIAAGAVGADQVAANAITTRHLVVADWSNLHPDPDLIRGTDSDLWSRVSWCEAVKAPDIGSNWGMSAGAWRARTPNPGTVWSGPSIKAGNITVQGGQDYVLSAKHRRHDAGTSNARIVIYFYDTTGTRITGSDKNVSDSTTSTVPNDIIVPFTAPEGAASIAVFYQQNPNSTSGFIIGDMSIRRAASAELIVDGAITANKIAANSIVAGKLAANSVATANLIAGSVVADKIATGAITAGKIAAGTITAGELAANAVTADKLAANSVTSAKISAYSILAEHLTANSIYTNHIRAGAVSADKMEVGTITAESGILANASIDTAHIKHAAVDTITIAGEAVTTLRAQALRTALPVSTDGWVTVLSVWTPATDLGGRLVQGQIIGGNGNGYRARLVRNSSVLDNIDVIKIQVSSGSFEGQYEDGFSSNFSLYDAFSGEATYHLQVEKFVKGSNALYFPRLTNRVLTILTAKR